jgi:hypothetical protein
MIPPEDDDEARQAAEWEYRRGSVNHAVSCLAIARAVPMDDGQLRVYIDGLLDLDLELVEEACRALGKLKRQAGETALPSIGDIRDRCWEIRREQRRVEEDLAQEEAYHRDREVIPQARAEMWKAHLKAVIQAKRYGHRPPPSPIPLDDTRVTYQCGECHDTGWIPACHCEQRSCRDCRYRTVRRCPCRPQAAPHVPPPPNEPPRTRGGKWHRSGG